MTLALNVARGIIVRNIFTEVNGKELPLSLHQGASRLLETFLPEFNSFQIRAFAAHLNSKYVRAVVQWNELLIYIYSRTQIYAIVL